MKDLLTYVTVALWLAVIGALLTTPAQAQAQCGQYEDVVAALQKHGETLAGRGVSAGEKFMVEVYRNPKTGSFSVLTVQVFTADNKLACLIVFGSDWTPGKKVISGKDA